MPMSAWRTENPAAPGVYVARTRWAWWSAGYWTRAGCLQALADFEAESLRMPRAEDRVVDWREVLP